MPEDGRRRIHAEMAKGRLRNGHLLISSGIAERDRVRRRRDGPQLEWGPSLSAPGQRAGPNAAWPHSA